VRNADPWQRSLSPGRQLADKHFSLDFQTDHKEENGHQAIIDPMRN
jgi:hypothetical protein